MTTVDFDLISNDPADLSESVEQTRHALAALSGVRIDSGPTRHYTFPTLPRSEQWRVTMYVAKQGRATTWNDVYTTVNGLHPGHAPCYRRR